MTDDLLIYEFADLRFSPFDSTLENTANGKKIKLTQTHCHFLLALILKSPETIEYDELRRKVWRQYAEMPESLKHLIHETKCGLVKILRREDFPSDFIEAKAGKGYRIKNPVRIVSESIPLFSAETEKPKDESSHTLFKSISALTYGLLFALALLLEIAYQFDRYGTTAIWLGLPLAVWNGAVMFAALSVCAKRFRASFGVSLLIVGAVFSCLAMSFFLPFEPITLARFQTQPAIAAFLKNALIYFLPLGIFCIFTPFYLFCRGSFQTLQNTLPNLFGLLFLALVYSLFSTFYLLDNLLPATFHALFVTLAFLRFIIYFGLGAACLLWAKAKLENE